MDIRLHIYVICCILCVLSSCVRYHVLSQRIEKREEEKSTTELKVYRSDSDWLVALHSQDHKLSKCYIHTIFKEVYEVRRDNMVISDDVSLVYLPVPYGDYISCDIKHRRKRSVGTYTVQASLLAIDKDTKERDNCVTFETESKYDKCSDMLSHTVQNVYDMIIYTRTYHIYSGYVTSSVVFLSVIILISLLTRFVYKATRLAGF